MVESPPPRMRARGGGHPPPPQNDITEAGVGPSRQMLRGWERGGSELHASVQRGPPTGGSGRAPFGARKPRAVPSPVSLLPPCAAPLLPPARGPIPPRTSHGGGILTYSSCPRILHPFVLSTARFPSSAPPPRPVRPFPAALLKPRPVARSPSPIALNLPSPRPKRPRDGRAAVRRVWWPAAGAPPCGVAAAGGEPRGLHWPMPPNGCLWRRHAGDVRPPSQQRCRPRRRQSGHEGGSGSSRRCRGRWGGGRGRVYHARQLPAAVTATATTVAVIVATATACRYGGAVDGTGDIKWTRRGGGG